MPESYPVVSPNDAVSATQVDGGDEVAWSDAEQIPSYPWPSLQYNLEKTADTPYAQASNGTVDWKTIPSNTSFSGRSISPPVLDEDNAYLKSRDNNDDCIVSAIRLLDGAEQWNTTTGLGYHQEQSPALSNGVVIFTGIDNGNSVRAYDVSDGSLAWSRSIERGGASPATPDGGGNIYVIDINGELYKLDALDGSTVWSVQLQTSFLSNEIFSAVCVGESNVFATTWPGGTSDHGVGAVSHDGNNQWTYDNKNIVDRWTPTYYNGDVYVGAVDGSLVSIDASTGNENWADSVGSFDTIAGQSAAISNDIAVVAGEENDIWAYNVSTRSLEWSSSGAGPFENPFSSHPTIASGKVYLTGGNSNAMQFDLSSGSLDWDVSLPSLRDNHAVYGGKLYASSSGDGLVAIE